MSAESVSVACVQVNAGTDMARNIETAVGLVRQACDAGADFVAMPENVSLIVHGREQQMAEARTEKEHPALSAFRDVAADCGVSLLIGSLAVRVADDRLANRSFLVDGEGEIVARYDKIHMFDVDLPGGESYRESATFQPGAQAVLAPSPWGPIGMTVCYDVRFAHLYRDLAKKGAAILTVPAAFTRQTGQAHWHVLLRARAIETGSFVVAPAQTGTHDRGRQTFGHSLIISPWGDILADGGESVGITQATLDLSVVDKARQAIPALRHDRDFMPAKPAVVVADRAAGE